MSDIGKNIGLIRKQIAVSAEKAGRDPADIKIVAVTKTLPTDVIMEAIDNGITDIGENKIQELCAKYETIGKSCNWHMIGHLQTNKAKYVPGRVDLVHSVDSLRIAAELDKAAAKSGIVQDVLIQVNISMEPSKFGIMDTDIIDLARKVSRLPNIKIRGLMTIAPYSSDPENARPVFAALRKIFIDIRNHNIDNISMDYLSMGMSGDFAVAVEEGANIVRIGTAIFGKRIYK